MDSAQYARSVREDTAELASYALRDSSPEPHSPIRPRTTQMQLESYFNGLEDEAASNREAERSRHDTIPEVPEPATPEEEDTQLGSIPQGTSEIANMLKTSPPSTSPPNNDGISDSGDTEYGSTKVGGANGRLIITSQGVQMDSTERTPLLFKTPDRQLSHPDWIHGEDLEGQHTKRAQSWPKIRDVFRTTKERGRRTVQTAINPKHWDGKAVWRSCIVAPANCLPAVVLGLLLNILDALSYGMVCTLSLRNLDTRHLMWTSTTPPRVKSILLSLYGY